MLFSSSSSFAEATKRLLKGIHDRVLKSFFLHFRHDIEILLVARFLDPKIWLFAITHIPNRYPKLAIVEKCVQNKPSRLLISFIFWFVWCNCIHFQLIKQPHFDNKINIAIVVIDFNVIFRRHRAMPALEQN